MLARKIALSGVIVSIYAAMCLVLAPFSYGPVQVRLAEVLTLLPVLCAEAVPGVAVGCLIANIFTGSIWDMAVGTAATFAAALCTRALRNVRLRNVPVLSAAPPVLFNAVAIGAMLTRLYFPAHSPAGVWLFNMLTVGAGQLVSCAAGLALVVAIEKNPAALRLFRQTGANGRG